MAIRVKYKSKHQSLRSKFVIFTLLIHTLPTMYKSAHDKEHEHEHLSMMLLMKWELLGQIYCCVTCCFAIFSHAKQTQDHAVARGLAKNSINY